MNLSYSFAMSQQALRHTPVPPQPRRCVLPWDQVRYYAPEQPLEP